ncbi:hypothetical protein INS49_004124 [Diaporthe citri]|uniref:uncharacterized protein n=1 Tax=Diaporthe citri TaxID=83186 RepID=UPI001C7ECC8F|nr:uncharacterized protein INS49_004124 [Diaporthe citri]KAG6355043.1 hypothetical protein INS49_004124 [Diaporthe citri]
MSLASPLSVGDAILLGKIAYEVGKAFSSGAKSAPAEFTEVQSLLFSMGDALDLVSKTFRGRTEQDVQEETAAKLDGILENSQTVLKSLEHFVDKYSVLEASQASISGANSARVWKREILKNFKKVAWTAEGEGIVKLKQTLTAHVQALNLAVAAMNGKKQAIMHEDVSDTREHAQDMRIKIDEIHAWYEENLKLNPQSHDSPRHNRRSSHDAGSFALYEERGNVRVLVERQLSQFAAHPNSIKYTAKLLNVVFRTTSGAFTVGRLSSIQVLQYGTTWHPDRLVEPAPAQFLPQAHVNMVLNCLSDDPQAQKCFTVRVNQDTNVSVMESPRYVAIEDAICFQEIINAGSQGSSPSDPVECSKITLEFSDSADAQEFLADLKDAKQKLRMQYLQQVRWGDKLIGQLDLPGELIIRNLVLQSVQLKVILDQVTGVFRMALVRRDHSACVTFELPPNFLDDLAAGKESGYEDHPAWFMDIGKDRITIIKQESGMDPLVALSKAFQDSKKGKNDQIEIDDMLPDSD